MNANAANESQDTKRYIEVKLVVPSTVNVKDPAPADLVGKWIDATMEQFCHLFGGCTAYHGLGACITQTHGLVKEPVMIVTSFTDKAGLSRLPDVKAFAAKMACDLKQESVLVQVDHSVEFIAPLKLAVA